MKKIITLGIMLLFIGMTVSSLAEETTLNGDDLDITIYAGLFGLDIGTDIRVDVKNNRNESITFYRNYTVDHAFFDFLDENVSYEHNIKGNGQISSLTVFPFSMSRFSITVEGGNTKVTREGILIFCIAILFK